MLWNDIYLCVVNTFSYRCNFFIEFSGSSRIAYPLHPRRSIQCINFVYYKVSFLLRLVL
jgi:hypothetical protein